MSQQPKSLNPDIKRLRDEGYTVALVGGFLVVRDVPYVRAAKQLGVGTFVCPLSGSGQSLRPERHVVFFDGDQPCDETGGKLSGVAASPSSQPLAGVSVRWQLSSKPASGQYDDCYHQISTYVKLLSHVAQVLDPSVTAKVFRPVEADEDSVFQYFDTASSRSKIDEISKRLALPRVAIIGLGGTGGYVLDSVAKCPVGEIHLFDKDFFLNHNAFRAPGAASLEELSAMPRKVDHFVAIYSKMHRHVIAHPYDIDAARIEELREMSFVFLCIDRAPDKELIVRKLQQWGIAFIDVGMGIKMVNDRLTGILRTTTSTDRLRSHIWEKDRISFSVDDDAMNEYATNIQVADLNALNALLAVVKWKKLQGFYADMDDEHYSHFVVNSNRIINDDYPSESR